MSLCEKLPLISITQLHTHTHYSFSSHWLQNGQNSGLLSQCQTQAHSHPLIWTDRKRCRELRGERESKRERDPGSDWLPACYSRWFHWLIELACQQSRCHSVSEFAVLLRITAAANCQLFPGGKGSPHALSQKARDTKKKKKEKQMKVKKLNDINKQKQQGHYRQRANRGRFREQGDGQV